MDTSGTSAALGGRGEGESETRERVSGLPWSVEGSSASDGTCWCTIGGCFEHLSPAYGRDGLLALAFLQLAMSSSLCLHKLDRLMNFNRPEKSHSDLINRD